MVQVIDFIGDFTDPAQGLLSRILNGINLMYPGHMPTDDPETKALVPVHFSPSTDLALPEVVVEQARDYAQKAKSKATRRAYTSAWARFECWCTARGQTPLPAHPLAVAAFLTEHTSLSVSALNISLAAIAYYHGDRGLPSPTTHPQLKNVWAGIRRTKGTRAARAKAAADLTIVRALTLDLDQSMKGLRDRAVILFGFASFLRRSALVGLNMEDLAFVPEGVSVLVRRDKTDQEGAGRIVGVARSDDESVCPVRALQAWLKAAGIEHGPIFRGLSKAGKARSARLHPNEVARIVQRAADRAGLKAHDFGGHSLRAGGATESIRQGKSDIHIMEQGGWASVDMLKRYHRETDPIKRGVGKLS